VRPERGRVLHRRHPDPAVDERLRASLRWSVFDGASFFAMVGAAEGYFQAFAVFMRGSVFQVALVSTLPIAVASVLQLGSAVVSRALGSRKRFNLAAGILRSALFVPLALAPLLGTARIWVLLALVCLYYLMNYLPNPAWTSWMRDLVADEQRGTYFGRRNAVANLVALAATVAAGLLLEAFADRPWYGFLLVFNLAFLASAASTIFLSLQYEPAGGGAGQRSLGLADFVRRLPRTNYGRFVILNFSLYCGAFLSSPLIVPYLLQELRFSYLQFMVATSLVSLFKFVALPLWGKLVDRYGSKKILALAVFLVCTTPFTWFLARSFAGVCAIQVWGAFAWAGFEIAAMAFAFDVMPAELVTEQTSFLLFFRGAATISGGLVGGILFERLRVAGSAYLALFLVSGLFRLAFVLPLLALIREERKVERISYPGLVLKLLALAPRFLLRRWFPGRPG